MIGEKKIRSLKATKEYFDRSTGCLEEEHSTFTPADGMFTVAQQVAHVAQTIDWFVDGIFGPDGFDMNFETHLVEVNKIKSLTEARAWLDRSFVKASDALLSRSDEELSELVPEGPVLSGSPRYDITSPIAEHTAHHRGSLTTYSRLLGLTPAMPYMEVPVS